MEKECTKCEKSKDIEEFGWKNKQKGYRHARCKECSREISNDLYQTSKTRKKSIKQNSKDQKIANRELVQRYKEFVGCQRCKEHKFKKYYLLDFHHKDPNEKEIEVSKLLARGRGILKKEIRKCIVLCANCHREVHYETVAQG